jgi:hypothetical protein
MPRPMPIAAASILAHARFVRMASLLRKPVQGVRCAGRNGSRLPLTYLYTAEGETAAGTVDSFAPAECAPAESPAFRRRPANFNLAAYWRTSRAWPEQRHQSFSRISALCPDCSFVHSKLLPGGHGVQYLREPLPAPGAFKLCRYRCKRPRPESARRRLSFRPKCAPRKRPSTRSWRTRSSVKPLDTGPKARHD